MTKYTPTKEDLQNAFNKTVPDVIAPDLKVLFCGINPGLYTAAIGHHFGRPGNRFWKALHTSGFTDTLLDPFEEKKLLEKGYGITNLVGRATLSDAELTEEELIEGRRHLMEKIERFSPAWVAIVGIGAYRKAFGHKMAGTGEQPKIKGTRIWVLPNPSGLNANYKPGDYTRLFLEFRLAVEKNPGNKPEGLV